MSYWRPGRLDEALALLAEGAVVAAGCTDLFPATDRPDLCIGQTKPILDITNIPELIGIERNADGLRIGAATSWTEILRAELPPALDALKQAAFEVGSVQIQNSATIAGNLCNASPAADGVPPLLVVDAEVELQSLKGSRRLGLAAFIKGPRQTALEPGELLTAIHIPKAGLAGVSGFSKLGARHYLVISIAMVAIRLDPASDDVAIAVGACSPVARRLFEVEATLRAGRPLDDATIAAALDPIDDVRADAAYRKRAAAVLTRRLLGELRHKRARAA